MKIVICLFVLMISLFAFAQDSLIWNTLYWREDGCFVTGDPSRPSAVANNSSWEAYMEDGRYPYTKIGNEMVRLPNCNLAVFEGTTPGSLFAMSRWQAFYSSKKEKKDRKWTKLVERTNEFPLVATRFVFDKNEEIAGWVGYKDVTGYGTNYLMIYNLKNKSISEMLPIGQGFEGMSAIALTPGKKEFVIAAVNIQGWCAAVKSYDYAGNVVKDYPTINSWFKDNKLCLGYSTTWDWQVNLAYDQSSNQYLFYFSREHGVAPHPKNAEEYRLDLENDRVIVE